MEGTKIEDGKIKRKKFCHKWVKLKSKVKNIQHFIKNVKSKMF